MFINHRNFLKGNLKVVLGKVEGEMHDHAHAQSVFTSGTSSISIVVRYHEYVYKPQEFPEGEFESGVGES